MAEDGRTRCEQGNVRRTWNPKPMKGHVERAAAAIGTVGASGQRTHGHLQGWRWNWDRLAIAAQPEVRRVELLHLSGPHHDLFDSRGRLYGRDVARGDVKFTLAHYVCCPFAGGTQRPYWQERPLHFNGGA